MARPVVPIIDTVKECHGGDEIVSTHPSFGQISVFKTSGHASLYGSDFRHQHYISIELHHSELHRSLSTDWPFQREMITRFSMSEAQWAQFVSSIGVGQGTQVTLDFVTGKGIIPGLPHRDEGAQFAKEGKEDIKACLDLLDQTIRTVTLNVEGLSKAKQAAILHTLTSSRAQLASSLPFVTKQFEKHLEERVEKAKIEVNAWMESTIRRAGLEAIAEKTGMPLSIGGPDEQAEQEAASGEAEDATWSDTAPEGDGRPDRKGGHRGQPEGLSDAMGETGMQQPPKTGNMDDGDRLPDKDKLSHGDQDYQEAARTGDFENPRPAGDPHPVRKGARIRIVKAGDQ